MNLIILGFAAGVMIAAAIFGLIIPAMENSARWGKLNFIPAVCGILLGSLFLVTLDKFIPHIHKNGKIEGPTN